MDEKKVNAILFGLGPTNLNTQGAFSGPPLDDSQAKAKADFSKRNTQGVPIETETEVPFSVRFGAALRPTDEDRLSFLNSYYRTKYPYFYKDSPARVSDTGEILVRLPTPEGAKDVMLNARGLTGEDIAALGAYGPELAGSALAVMMGRKVPAGAIKRLADKFPKAAASVESAAGAGAVGAAKDVAVRAAGDQKIDPKEIARRRGLEFLMGLGIDAGIAGGVGIGKRVMAPFSQTLQGVDADLAEAVSYFKDNHGIDFPLTAAEHTGSPLLKRTEAMMERLPGSSKTMGTVRDKQRGATESIQTSILGESRDAIPSEESVSREAVSALEKKVKPIVEGAAQKRLRVVEMANKRVLDLIDSTHGAQRQVYPERVGAGIRAKVVAQYDALQEQSALRYGALEALPGGTDRILTTKSLSSRAQGLLDSLSSALVTKEKPSGVLGPKGEALNIEVQELEKLRELLPEGVEAMLTRLANLKDAQFSLRDMIRARNGIDNKIAKEAATIPTARMRELTELRKLMDDSLNEAVDSIPDKRLRDMYQKTNAWYRDERQKFDDVTLKKLFADFDKSGGIRDEDIVRNIGLSEYQVFKKFLGESSPEFQALRRSIADSVIEAASPSGRIEGKALIKELSALYSTKRSIAEDVFGKKGRPLHSQLQTLGEVLNSAETKIDADKFRALLNSDKPLDKAVRDLAAAEAKLNKAYRSDILKKVGEGTLGSADLDPGKFIDLVYSHASPKEVSAVVAQLSDQPELLQRLRQKAIERVFFDAQRALKATDPARLGKAELFRPPSTTKLEGVLGQDANRGKLETLLGKDTMKDLEMFGKLIRGQESVDESFRTAGALAGGAAVASMIRRGPLSYAGEWVQQKVAAAMLTWPGLKKIAGMRPEDYGDDLAIKLITVEPYFQNALQEGGVNIGDIYNEMQKGEERYLDAREQRVLQILGPPPNQ